MAPKFNNIDLLDIESLFGMNFFIPSYQRGYRWNKQQVEDLLNDINEFDNAKDGKFYCLQPLVLKEKENSWVVIDGQQRLTSIYLILNYLDNQDKLTIQYQRASHFENLNKTYFSFVDLEDWDKCLSLNWENHLKFNKEDDNIEFYHLFVAKLLIYRWFEFKSEEFKNTLKVRLLEETKFIWYNVGDADEHELFKNLNSGKIALTNAELIKALFLNNTGSAIAGKELKQNLIAEEFDQMERALREDDMWYFLAGNQEKFSSCIDLIFNLMLDTADNKHIELINSKDNFRTFFYFKKLILHDIEGVKITDDEQIFENAKTIWKKVQTYFYTLDGWNRNEDTYNLIGYLVACNIELKEIYNLLFLEATDKINFINNLKEKCKKIISYPNHLEFNYKKDAVWKLLLQFNIAALLIKKEEKLRFSFSEFHKFNWDVEHISPQNPKDDIAFDKLLAEYQDCFLPHELKNYFDIDTLQQKRLEIKSRYFAEDPDILGNLTLLRDKENRGIGNRFFFDKRTKLKEYFQFGAFIPTCSMNVFVKFYSKNPEQMLFWDENDQNDYLDSMDKVFNSFYEGDK
jgi:uncharacterized protein with ParB-like and HNH nuclease domain